MKRPAGRAIALPAFLFRLSNNSRPTRGDEEEAEEFEGAVKGQWHSVSINFIQQTLYINHEM